MKRAILITVLAAAVSLSAFGQEMWMTIGYQYRYTPLSLELFNPYDNKTYGVNEATHGFFGGDFSMSVIGDYEGINEKTYLVIGGNININYAPAIKSDIFTYEDANYSIFHIGLYALGQYPFILGKLTLAPQAGFQWEPINAMGLKFWLKGGLALYPKNKPGLYVQLSAGIPVFAGDKAVPRTITSKSRSANYNYMAVSKMSFPYALSITLGFRGDL
jgi:hypothetical protein